jgi:hypothetical protein
VRNFTISLMNYRCFSGNAPTTWTFKGDALTSFVGPNNAGKSTILRLFYELRNVFAAFSQEGNLRSFLSNQNQGMSFNGTSDNSAEIWAHRTVGPVFIELSIEVEDPNELSRLRLQMNDRRTLAWSTQIWAGPAYSEVKVVSTDYPPTVRSEGHDGALKSGEFLACMKVLSENVIYIPAYRT